MSSTLAILCPVTSRNCGDAVDEQPLLKALIPSLMALRVRATLLIGYDSDDPVWSQLSARASVKFPALRWIELHALQRNITGIFNWLAREADFDYLIAGNDDLAFQTSPHDAMAQLAARDDFGTIAFHDDAFPGLPTFYMVGRPHFEIFDVLYPLPWTGAHQDSWIHDVYKPWGASEIDPRIRCHNHIGAATRFEYGGLEGYREAVMRGRRRVRDWRGDSISDDELMRCSFLC